MGTIFNSSTARNAAFREPAPETGKGELKMMKTLDTLEPVVESHANRDPITGEPGSHPVGTGLGSAGGEAAGAAVCAVGGEPVEAVVRGVAGAVPGGTAGHAEKADQRFEDVESELERTWPTRGGNSPYKWRGVRDASREFWTRIRGR